MLRIVFEARKGVLHAVNGWGIVGLAWFGINDYQRGARAVPAVFAARYKKKWGDQ